MAGDVRSADVVIVGGGIAGLAAAYELSRHGRSFVVLEASDRAGGVILSEEVDRFTIDAGPDALLIQKPEAIRLCEELGLGERLVTTKLPRLAYIQRGGRLHALPAGSVLGIPTRVGPFLRTPLFSWRGKLRMGFELFVPPRGEDSDESIGAFMRRRFGREATEYLAEPLLAGIHAGDVDRLSMKSLFPRFRDAERKHGSLLRAFASPRRNGSPAANPHAPNPKAQSPNPDGAFKSLPGGLSEMVHALVAALGPGAVRTRSAVVDVAGKGPFEVRTADGDLWHARTVVLAAPAYVAGALLRARDASIAGLCEAVPYASVATVALAFRRDAIAHPLNGSGFVVPRVEHTGILAGSWLSSKWPHRAPDAAALLRTFIGGARDPELPGRDDRELVELSLRALTPLLGIRADPLFTRVYRWTRANAQHEVGHLDRVAAIDRALAAHPGLFVTGSGYRGVGIPDCVADGRRTARQVIERLKADGLNSRSLKSEV
jgi:protoporphyrinogen/coproporphyrinogen III oxidase